MDLKHVLLLLSVIGLSAGAEAENTLLKRLEAADTSLQRRAEVCDDLIESCVEWEEQCLETTDLCSTGWVSECQSWTEDCVAMHSECTEGWEDTCKKTEKQCTGGWGDVCTAWSHECTKYMPWPYNSLCMFSDDICTATEYTCKGWEEVCISTSTTCKGFKEVCDQTVKACDLYEPVCEGVITTACTGYGEVCTATGVVCNVAVNTVEAIVEAVTNFGECLDNAWDSFVKDPTSAVDTSCSDNPLNNVECYVSAKGQNVWDGFTAGCTLPTITLGVEFGSVEGDKNTSVATIEIGDWPLEIPLLEEEWNSRPLKEFLYIDASSSFTFVNDAVLDVDGMNYDLTIPGVEWNFDAGVTLFAEESHDPCEEDIDECRIVLNKGNTNVFQHSFAVGAIPVVITITAEVYIGAYPKFEGTALTELRVFFDDDGVTLLHSVDLELDKPEDALVTIQDMVDATALVQEVIEKIRFEVTGELEATASLDLCLGVILGFTVNGVGSEMDIPVCLTAALEVAASADLSGAELEVGASLTLNALEIPFELDVPDISAVVDTACGFVQAPMEQLSPVTSCVPVVECFTNFVDDTCEGVSEAVSPLDISIKLGAITIFDEYEIWSASVTLSTGSEEEEDTESESDGSASVLDGCSRYEGFDMASGFADEPSTYTQTDTLEECEELCLSSPDCAQYTWHSELGDWENRCVMWTLPEARANDRTDPETWAKASYRTSGRCTFWVNINNGAANTCKSSLLVQTYTISSLEECKYTCEANPQCNYIYKNAEECRMYSACYGNKEAAPEGTIYQLTDSEFDQKAKLTFVRTGCPNALVDTSAWQTQTHANVRSYDGEINVSDDRIWSEMYETCMAVRGGSASHEQRRQCCGDDSYNCVPGVCHPQQYWAWEGAYELAFRQTMPFLWNHDMVTNEQTWEQGLNMKDKDNDNYAILHWMDKLRPGGRYYFKMVWPEDPDVYYTWSQTNDPLYENIAGYEAGHIPFTGKSWGGLEPSETAIMDGSVKSSESFYSVGAYATFNGGYPSYAKNAWDWNYPQQQVELYALRGFQRRDEGIRIKESTYPIDLGFAADATACAELVQANIDCSTTQQATYQDYDAFQHDQETGACACQRWNKRPEYETTVDTEWTTSSENIVVYNWI